MTMMRARQRVPLERRFSPAYLYNAIANDFTCQTPLLLQEGVDFAVQCGGVPWRLFEYDELACRYPSSHEDLQPGGLGEQSCPGLHRSDAHEYRLRRRSYLPTGHSDAQVQATIDDIRAALQRKHPVPFTMKIDNRFHQCGCPEGTGVWRRPTTGRGAHAMVIVGHSGGTDECHRLGEVDAIPPAPDAVCGDPLDCEQRAPTKTNAFLLQNSYGETWGDHGRVWIDDCVVARGILEAFVLHDAGPVDVSGTIVDLETDVSLKANDQVKVTISGRVEATEGAELQIAVRFYDVVGTPVVAEGEEVERYRLPQLAGTNTANLFRLFPNHGIEGGEREVSLWVTRCLLASRLAGFDSWFAYQVELIHDGTVLWSSPILEHNDLSGGRTLRECDGADVVD